jgi:hypothetical protein
VRVFLLMVSSRRELTDRPISTKKAPLPAATAAAAPPMAHAADNDSTNSIHFGSLTQEISSLGEIVDVFITTVGQNYHTYELTMDRPVPLVT